LACISWDKLSEAERQNTREAFWCSIDEAKKLAYDHDEIVRLGFNRLQSKIKYTNLIAKLLPGNFTLSELKDAYELILGYELDKRNFIKKINQLDCLIDTGYKTFGQKARPAVLYRFKSKKVIEMNIIG